MFNRSILFKRIPITVLTILIGICGAAAGWILSIPAALLVGPARAVTLASVAGMRMGITDWLRDVCMVALGLGIGAGFTADASAAILRWPLAFAVLAVMLVLALQIIRMVLERGFGFDRKSAVLAAIPGHLSLVLGIAAGSDLDVGRIALVQTIRLLALTVVVPFAALAMGYEMQATVMPLGPPMQVTHLAALTIAGLALALFFKRVGLPAPMLLGPMIVSSLSHMAGLTPGALPGWIMSAAFLGLGTLIGARFSGMPAALVRSGLLAGIASTCISVGMAALAALPVAMALNMPAAHVLTAFAPGGLETMIALGAAMGASPGFVAACHVMRLVVLSVLLPLFLRQRRAVSHQG
jgi:membrane AbrB-like protein